MIYCYYRMVKSMKKDIRTGLLFVSIFYVVAIVFLMIMNFCLSTSSIELHDSDENVKKIKELRREALALEVNKCSVVINDMITYYEKTSFDGDVNLKEKYDMLNQENVSFLEYYLQIKEHCGLTDEERDKYDYPHLFMTAAIQNEAMLQRYLYQYELGFKDLYFRMIAEPNLNNTEYLIRKRAELKAISSVIEMVKERGVFSE